MVSLTRREKFVFNPEGDTGIDEGDILLVIGEKSFISEFKLVMHKKRGRHEA